MKKINYTFAFLAILLLSACTPRIAAPPKVPTVQKAVECPREVRFAILQLNDVYEISPLDNGKFGGMARVATVRNELIATGQPVITVLDGDYLNPSLIGSLKCDFPDGSKERVNGRHMVDVMNVLGVDYVTFGNHEFDLKADDLIARNNESKFKIISANVRYAADKGIVRFFQGENMVPDYWVHRIANDKGDTLKLGLLGLTLPFNQQSYLQYLDIYETGKNILSEAQKESDVVFGITHLTMDQDDTLAQKVPGMPLIMGGHEHSNMTRQVGETKICKADANAKTVYIHWCKYDFTTGKMEIYSQLMPVTEAIQSDPIVDKVVQKWESFANECMASQGYAADDTIGFAMVPLDGRDASVRTGPTNLGTLICDAMQAIDPRVQIALLNSGSIRLDDQISGFVKQRNILASLPFGGDVQVGEVKGSDLKQLLDTGLSEEMHWSGAFLQHSSKLEQSGGTYLIDGKALDENAKYWVIMPGFLAGGGEAALSFVKDLATWADPDMQAASASGLQQNDIRDIVIWFMKQNYTPTSD